MAAKWYFTRQQLADTPSRRNGIDNEKELSYRQQAANLIQDMGQRLSVYPLKFEFNVTACVLLLRNCFFVGKCTVLSDLMFVLM